MKWRVYYDGGATFDSTQGEPEDAPSWGIACIVQPYIESGRTITQGYDYYVFTENMWIGMDRTGVLDYLIQRRCLKIGPTNSKLVYTQGEWQGMSDDDLTLWMLEQYPIIAGRMIPKQRFLDIFRVANSDPDFPVRTAFTAQEKERLPKGVTIDG
jgi:hypothetical protein